MKKILVLLVMISGSRFGIAQNTAYVSAVEAQLKEMDTATVPATFADLSRRFEAIGQGWEAWYYAAYCNIVQVQNMPDKSNADPILDQAERQVKQAAALNPGNADIVTVQAMIVYSRVLVNPNERWQSLNEGDAYLDKAKKIDPENPRPYLVEAKVKLNTPEMLGGGADVAKTALETGISKLKTFRPAGSIAPKWGSAQASLLQQKIGQ